ncbi:hypothetical protein EDB85DRAFT_1938666 [Lactarius pseudohatsudake]|nr:hypothetical protein EDB85DRAFT_1938666 [Lactarius pseudohatsudake]
MGKSGAGDRVPSRAPFLHVRDGAAKGERVPGVACPCAPLPRERGGAKREGEEGGSGSDAERRRGVPSCAPFYANGEGRGWLASCAPSVRMGRCRQEGRGGEWWGRVPPLLRKWGREGVACPLSVHTGRGRGQHALVHPLSARIGCCGQGKGGRRQHALVHHPSA